MESGNIEPTLRQFELDIGISDRYFLGVSKTVRPAWRTHLKVKALYGP
jgi:hypothetical protein